MIFVFVPTWKLFALNVVAAPESLLKVPAVTTTVSPPALAKFKFVPAFTDVNCPDCKLKESAAFNDV